MKTIIAILLFMTTICGSLNAQQFQESVGHERRNSSYLFRSAEYHQANGDVLSSDHMYSRLRGLGGKYIVAQTYHTVYKNESRDPYLMDEIWVALDTTLQLVAIFPRGTESAWWVERAGVFYFSTFMSSGVPYNGGIMDKQGHLIEPAREFRSAFLLGEYVLSLQTSAESDASGYFFKIRHVSNNKYSEEFKLAPLRTSHVLWDYHYSEEDKQSATPLSDQYFSAVNLVLNLQLESADEVFKRLTSCQDELIRESSRINRKTIRKIKKYLKHHR